MESNMVKEAETTIQRTPTGQLLIYFSKKLDMPFKKGDKINVQIVGNTIILEKVK